MLQLQSTQSILQVPHMSQAPKAELAEKCIKIILFQSKARMRIKIFSKDTIPCQATMSPQMKIRRFRLDTLK